MSIGGFTHDGHGRERIVNLDRVDNGAQLGFADVIRCRVKQNIPFIAAIPSISNTPMPVLLSAIPTRDEVTDGIKDLNGEDIIILPSADESNGDIGFLLEILFNQIFLNVSTSSFTASIE